MGPFYADSTENVQGVVIAKKGVGRQRESIPSGPNYSVLPERSQKKVSPGTLHWCWGALTKCPSGTAEKAPPQSLGSQPPTQAGTHSFPKLARMWLRHDRSYHTWLLLGLQGFRHLFERTCWAIWLLWVTGSGTWRPRQLLQKEKIKSTLCHLFLSFPKCRTASKQSLRCSLSTSLPHLSLLLCILILINISKRFVLQLGQVCPGSIVGCLVQLLLPFSVEEPAPLWADVCLEESLQLRSLHGPQQDHGLCITQSREAIKPPPVFEVPLPHITLSSFQPLPGAQACTL